MASKFETGHFRNLTNFNKLTEYVKLIPTYLPDAFDLQVAQLESAYADTMLVSNDLIEKASQLQQSINDRQQLFAKVSKLAKKLMQYLEANIVDEAAINDVKGIYKMMNSRKLSKKEVINDDGTMSVKSYSSSRLSFDSIAENFQKMVERIAMIPGYAPSDTSLQIANLKATYESMHTTNANINAEYIAVNNVRVDRNQKMYKKNTGLVDVALRVKKHLRSMYGSNSEEAHYANQIEFRKVQVRD